MSAIEQQDWKLVTERQAGKPVEAAETPPQKTAAVQKLVIAAVPFQQVAAAQNRRLLQLSRNKRLLQFCRNRFLLHGHERLPQLRWGCRLDQDQILPTENQEQESAGPSIGNQEQVCCRQTHEPVCCWSTQGLKRHWLTQEQEKHLSTKEQREVNGSWPTQGAGSSPCWAAARKRSWAADWHSISRSHASFFRHSRKWLQGRIVWGTGCFCGSQLVNWLEASSLDAVML